MAGFVFHEKSPRHIDLAAAHVLGRLAAGRIAKVALTVDAGDEALAHIVAELAPELLQLHGSETPERVRAVKARFKLPVIKAIGVSSAEDVLSAKAYDGAADIILYDAKPAPGAKIPGGAGVAFDWRLLHGLDRNGNWMLSGGLDPENVGEALRLTRAPGVDVSSGVESERGVKDEARIRAFVEAARALS
jgi:phosphoribosylanthranilate isomerase